MHVMVEPDFGKRQIAAVAFELNGSVLAPHELLQYDDRWMHAKGPFYSDVLQALRRFTSRWLGVRGMIWSIDGGNLSDLSRDFRACGINPTWSAKQQLEIRSLVWAASKLARESMEVPPFPGGGDNLLHEATRKAVLVQAAYRALSPQAA